MRMWRKIFGKPAPQAPPEPRAEVIPGELVRLAGTTTFAKEEAARVAERFVGPDGYAELEAIVIADSPDVIVHDTRIGCLPTYKAQDLATHHKGTIPVALQIFVSESTKGRRVDAWAWIGSDLPRWEYTRENRPPTTKEQRARRAQQTRHELVEDALKAGGARAAQFADGIVDGFHYLELVEPIKQLKREGHLEQALKLCYRAIEGAERDRGSREPAPFYTLQAAMIHRKLKQPANEVAVLQRWLDACPPERRAGSKVAERLNKLQA